MSTTLSTPVPRTATPNLSRTPLLVVVGVLLLRPALLFASNLALAPILGSYRRALPFANVAIVPIDVLCLLLVRTLLHRQGRTIRGVLGARWRDSGWAALCAVILLVAFLAGNFVANLIAYQGPPPTPVGGGTPPLWLGIWAITIMPITIALAEQLLYRGFALDTLAGRFGAVGSLLFVSFFFALQHTALTPLDGRAQLARFITTFVAGITMGLLYRWRKLLWPVVVAHWFLDVIGLGLPLLLAALR